VTVIDRTHAPTEPTTEITDTIEIAETKDTEP
jgi:hypothetical protein